MLALALSITTIVVLFALSPRAMAEVRSASCRSSSTAHLKRDSGACAQAGHVSKLDRKSKGHSHAKVRGHHSKHSKKGKHKTKAKRKATARTHALAPALCEDGSAPVNEGGGSFSCADESEPVCSNGTAPVLSSNGHKLLCAVKAGDSGQTEAVCEDGSAPIAGGEGSFSCDDESMPVCEDGSIPALSSSGLTLVCAPESSDDSGASEVGCNEGTVAVQAPDGSYSCVGSSEPGCEEAPAPVLSSERWTPICDAGEDTGEDS
jgi:hypothetical protein